MRTILYRNVHNTKLYKLYMLDINNQRKGGQMLVLQKIFFPRSKVLRGDVECVFQRY